MKRIRKILPSLIILFLGIGVFLYSFLLQKPKEVKLGHGILQGDANNDGRVDILDFQLLSNSFGKIQGQAGYNPSTDFNNDTRIDILDFQLLSNNFGRNTSPTPSRTTTPTPGDPTPPTQGNDMWLSSSEIATLPTSGPAWDRLRTTAYGTWGTPDLKNQDNKYGLNLLAGALVYKKTGDVSLRSKVKDGILAAKATMDQPGPEWETRNGVLSLGRQLGAFVIAADLINLRSFDSAADNTFRNWLSVIRTATIGGHSRWYTLTRTCENSANNWGTFACPSLLTAHIYLNDSAGIQRVTNIFRAWLGERQYYPADAPGENGYFQPTIALTTSPAWVCNTSSWTAVNPACSKNGVNLDGVLVEDISRGGACCTIAGDGIGYSWEALQGVYVTAELLHRRGIPTYSWSNNALKRATEYMRRTPAAWEGRHDVANYVIWIANKRYSLSYPTEPTSTGRIMSWTDWTHQ